MLRKAFRIITGFDLPTKKTGRPHLSAHSAAHRQAKLRQLIRSEAKIGGTLFGEVTPTHRREFFCLDKHTWIWFEEWFDEKTGTMRYINVQYDVQPQGILKRVDGIPRGYVTGQELTHLVKSMQLYYEKVATEVYHRQFAAA